MGIELLTAGVGLVGNFMASNAQKNATNAAMAMQQQQLDFDKKRYDDWYNVYGTQQEEIGEYFKNLTGEELSAKQIEEIQKAGQATNEQITTTLAQRGMTNNGLEASLLNSNTFDTEQKKAEARADSEEDLINQKMKFLSIGLGQEAGIANSMANTRTNMGNLAIQAGNNSASSIGTSTGIITQGITDYYNNNRNSSIGD